MKRCAPALAAASCIALAGALPLVFAPEAAHAQQLLLRPFPAHALRGQINFVQPPEIELNGRAARLAPGSRIRGMDNLLLMPGAVAGQRAVVHYTLDANGQVLDVWVLTAEERARVPWPTTPEQAAAWTFDPVSQTWSRP